MYTALFFAGLLTVLTHWMLRNKKKAGGFDSKSPADVGCGCFLVSVFLLSAPTFLVLGSILVVRWINT